MDGTQDPDVVISPELQTVDAFKSGDPASTVVEACGKPILPTVPPVEPDPCTKALAVPKVKPKVKLLCSTQLRGCLDRN